MWPTVKRDKKEGRARRRKLENDRALGSCHTPRISGRVSAQSITPGEGPAARENAVGVTGSTLAWDGDLLPRMAQPQSPRASQLPSAETCTESPTILHTHSRAPARDMHPRDKCGRGCLAWPPMPSTSWPQPTVRAPFQEPSGTHARLQLRVLIPRPLVGRTAFLPVFLPTCPSEPRAKPTSSEGLSSPLLPLTAVPLLRAYCILPTWAAPPPPNPELRPLKTSTASVLPSCFPSIQTEVRVYKRLWLEAKHFFN